MYKYNVNIDGHKDTETRNNLMGKAFCVFVPSWLISSYYR
jgi:hypothetical protein